MKKVFRCIWKVLCTIDTVMPCVGVAFMGVILMAQIIMRYVFNHPLSWSEELARYTYVWVCYIGLGYCVRHHTNIRMEAIQKIMPPVVRKWVNVLLNAIVFVMFGMLLPYSWDYALTQFSRKTPALSIPKGFITISVPIGIVLLLLNVVVDTVKIITSKPEDVVVSGSKN